MIVLIRRGSSAVAFGVSNTAGVIHVREKCRFCRSHAIASQFLNAMTYRFQILQLVYQGFAGHKRGGETVQRVDSRYKERVKIPTGYRNDLPFLHCQKTVRLFTAG